MWVGAGKKKASRTFITVTKLKAVHNAEQFDTILRKKTLLFTFIQFQHFIKLFSIGCKYRECRIYFNELMTGSRENFCF